MQQPQESEEVPLWLVTDPLLFVVQKDNAVNPCLLLMRCLCSFTRSFPDLPSFRPAECLYCRAPFGVLCGLWQQHHRSIQALEESHCQARRQGLRVLVPSVLLELYFEVASECAFVTKCNIFNWWQTLIFLLCCISHLAASLLLFFNFIGEY